MLWATKAFRLRSGADALYATALFARSIEPDFCFQAQFVDTLHPMQGGPLSMTSEGLSRRDLLKIGAAAGTAEIAALLLPGCGAKNAASTVTATTACSMLTDIDHVIFIQENRSSDHYFEGYRGVRGFSDQSAAFRQPDPSNTASSPSGVLLPFHFDTLRTNSACTHDIAHDWVTMHQSWNDGAMDAFVTSRLPIDGTNAVLSMGYYTRADLPLYYAVADAFTLCDNYFCSVMGPTDPNRLYTMAASIDPAGQNGGPVLQTLPNRSSFFGKLTYTTMPEQLQVRGISWKVYGSPDQDILNGVSSRTQIRRSTRTHSCRSFRPIFCRMQ
jgi:phospholipase C